MKVTVRDELEVISECELEISSWVKSVCVLQQQCKRLEEACTAVKKSIRPLVSQMRLWAVVAVKLLLLTEPHSARYHRQYLYITMMCARRVVCVLGTSATIIHYIQFMNIT